MPDKAQEEVDRLRRRAERERERREEAERIAERATRNLYQRQAQLEEAHDRLERLTFVAYHDLQEPLRDLVTSVQQLQREAEGLGDEAQAALDRAVDAAREQQELLEDLLAYADATRSEAAREPVDLDEQLDAVLDELADRIDENDAVVQCDGLPTVEADADQVRVLLHNLISNALKFGGEGVHVQVRGREEPREWHVEVEDDGPGIDEAYHDKVLEVFQQLDAEKPGTGLGLSLCSSVVEQHGGDLWIEAEPGEGTTVHATLAKPSPEDA